MLKKYPINQLKITLVMTTLVLPFWLSSGKTLGATLTFNSDKSFTDGVNFIEAAGRSNTLLNAESLFAESLKLFNHFDLNTAFLEDESSQSSSELVNPSLSLQSVVETLGQLNLKFNPHPKNTAKVPTLPQVEASNIFKGVYDFTPKAPRSSPSPVNSVSFNSKTVAPPPNPGSFRQNTTNLGSHSISLPSQGGALGILNPPQTVALGINRPSSSSPFVRSLERVINPLGSSRVDARFGILPGVELNVHLKDLNASLSSVAQKLDRSFDLKINTTFRLLPQTILATSLDLTDDGLRKSTLIRRDVDTASLRLKSLLQESSQQYEQIINQRQAQYQQQIQENVAQQLRQQQQLEETARLQQQEQQRLFQSQLQQNQLQQSQQEQNIQRQF